MLRLYDARTGHVSDVRCARAGRLVIQVASPVDLRGLVLADTIRRLSERQRLRVFLFSGSTPDGPSHDSSASASDSASDSTRVALNIRAGLSGEVPGADLNVGGFPLASVRALELGPSAERLPSSADVAARGLDPLALRLAILRRHYRDAFDLSWADLEEATADLARWRGEVAEWARSPGRPMSAGYVAQTQAALCDDLDIAGALRTLRRLATDPDVPPGAKFESFVHLDLILALDLVAELGS